MSGKITFISAGAGSGKTHQLTKILHQQLTDGVNPAGVIATTFTRKAAAELRERTRSYLLKENEFALANAIGQARIGTVNSICGELLGRFAFEAGLSPQLHVLEEAQSTLLYRDAIEVALTDKRIERLYQLAHRLGIEDWQDHVRAIADLARSNAVDSETLNCFANKNTSALLSLFPAAQSPFPEEKIVQEIDHLIPQVEQAIVDKPNQKNLRSWLDEIAGFRKKLLQSHYGPAWSEWAKLVKASPPAILKNTAEPLLQLLAGYEAHPRLQQDIGDYIELVFSIAGTALQDFEQHKRDLGAIDFIDQERKLLDILGLPEIRQALSGEIELLLVDEFQDTSPIQLALFAELSQLAQRTYWVGDTKQAIYGFRGSDSRLMETILVDLENRGNKSIALDTSWRSRPSLVTLVNEVFTLAFADTMPAERVTLHPKRENYSQEPALQFWKLKADNKGEQAGAVAAGIRALIAESYCIQDRETQAVRPVTYSDIAVLARTNDAVLRLAKALSEAGIPTETTQPGLLSKPEAILAIACLRRLVDAADTLATAEIVSLTSGNEPEVWLQHRFHFLATREKGEWNRWLETGEDAHPIIRRLAELRPQVQLWTVKEALEQVIAECHVDFEALAWSQNYAKARLRLANLQALTEMASDYENFCQGAGRVSSISGFILWLTEQEKARLDSLAEAGTDSVRVLTYHSSKGLEWPVTICTELDSQIRSNLWGTSAQSAQNMDVAEPLKERFIHFWPWPFGKQIKKMPLAERADQSPQAARFMKDAVEEAKRLLYVGLTRARDLLVLTHPLDKNGNSTVGEWLGVLDCPQLSPQDDVTKIIFPSGISLPCTSRVYEPEDAHIDHAPALTQAVHWYQYTPPASPRLPLIVNPSASEPVTCHIAEIASIGLPLQISGSPDPDRMGQAIHAGIAAAAADKTNLNTTQIKALLNSYDVVNAIDPDLLTGQIAAFFTWCEKRHGIARLLPEHSVEMVTPNGQYLVGQIDLLIDLPQGWILIDHKASTKSEAALSNLANSYSGQLNAYITAIEASTNRDVAETWLYFPIAGKAARVELGSL